MTGPSAAATHGDTGWFGHPRGLSTLFFTEMWERFSYYGMRAFLILYMTAAVSDGGLGISVARAGPMVGNYTSSVWLAAIVGGIIADRWLGAYRGVLYGGILIGLGHFTLAFAALPAFYAGLTLIVIGTGLLKPNATTMVGMLYDAQDARRDSGFSLFYMGINLGAFLGPLVAGGLAENVNWHLGFACAGVGMTLGLIQYVLGRDRLPAAARDAPRPAAASAGAVPRTGLTTEEWGRIGAVFVFFVFAALFWAAYEQAASTLNLFARDHADRTVFGWQVPASWFLSIQALFVIVLSPAFAWLWIRLGPRQPSTPVKFAYGLLFVGVSFVLLLPAGAMAQRGAGVMVSSLWLVAAYFLQVVGELCLSPVGNSVVTKLAPARIVGMMMGVWFLAIAAGNKVAGLIAGLSATVPFTTLFGAVAAATIGAAVVLFLLIRPIRRLMGGVH